MNNRLVAMLLVVAAAAAGCSDSGKSDGADKKGTARAATTGAVDAVAAALQSVGTPLASVGFSLATAPVVGVQSTVLLSVSAPAPGPTLLLTVEGESGLEVDPATSQASLALVDGVPATHSFKFTPQRDGLMQFTVRLRTAEPDSLETKYAIPVLVAKAATGG